MTRLLESDARPMAGPGTDSGYLILHGGRTRGASGAPPDARPDPSRRAGREEPSYVIGAPQPAQNCAVAGLTRPQWEQTREAPVIGGGGSVGAPGAAPQFGAVP
jgi:hypothetical protein